MYTLFEATSMAENSIFTDSLFFPVLITAFATLLCIVLIIILGQFVKPDPEPRIYSSITKTSVETTEGDKNE